jgi:hypothetical protein
MIGFFFFFIISVFFLKRLGSFFLTYGGSSTNSKKQTNSSFFEKIMQEMMENLKRQQNFFNQHSSQNHKDSRNWGEQNQNSNSFGSTSSSISRREALEILGLNDSATDEEIKAKYRSMILKFHPDSGGNEYFSRKLTDARDCLLKK